MISSQECHNCADKTADVIDSGNDAFELGAWIIELGAKRRQADYGTENTLVISKELTASQSVQRLTVKLPKQTCNKFSKSCITSTHSGAAIASIVQSLVMEVSR